MGGGRAEVGGSLDSSSRPDWITQGEMERGRDWGKADERKGGEKEGRKEGKGKREGKRERKGRRKGGMEECRKREDPTKTRDKKEINNGYLRHKRL